MINKFFSNKKFGNHGEKIATDFLKNKGLKILEKNWKVKTGEIDLIAKKDSEIIFVEVKTILKNDYFSPEDHFTYFKIKKLQKLAQTYFLFKKMSPENYRFDLIAIVISPFDENNYEIRHYENIISEDF